MTVARSSQATPPGATSLTRSLTRSQPRSLASMPQSKSARSRTRPFAFSCCRIAQTCLALNGGLGADDPPRIPWRRWRTEEITLSHARLRRLAKPLVATVTLEGCEEVQQRGQRRCRVAPQAEVSPAPGRRRSRNRNEAIGAPALTSDAVVSHEEAAWIVALLDAVELGPVSAPAGASPVSERVIALRQVAACVRRHAPQLDCRCADASGVFSRSG